MTEGDGEFRAMYNLTVDERLIGEDIEARLRCDRQLCTLDVVVNVRDAINGPPHVAAVEVWLVPRDSATQLSSGPSARLMTFTAQLHAMFQGRRWGARVPLIGLLPSAAARCFFRVLPTPESTPRQ